MLQAKYIQQSLSYFNRWTRNKAAVLISLKRIVKICVLSVSLLIIRETASIDAQATDTLTLSKIIDLEEVEVVGQASPDVFSQIARTITIISSQEISSSPASTIQDLLEYVAGVDIRQRNTHGVQADIQIRGGTFDQVLIMLNGISISDPQTGHFNLNLPISLSSIDRIEILHGSAARYYGSNAYKGVINIITRKEKNELSGGIAFGSYSLFNTRFSAGRTTEKFFHNLDFSKSKSNGYAHNTDFSIGNINYEGGLKFSPLNIFWQGGISAKAFGANDFYSPVFPDQYEETETSFGSLGFETKGNLKLKAHAWYRQHKDHFLLKRDEPSFYENFHKTDVFGIKISTDLNSILGKTHIGIEAREESILSTILGNELEEAVVIKGFDSAWYSNKYQRNNIGFHFDQRYQTEHFFISGGFLLNRNPDYANTWEIFPGLDISYKVLEDRLKIFSSAGRNLRLPTFTDMFYSDPVNIGNPLLQPEELLSFEFGLELKTKQLNTRMSYFNDFGSNVIDWAMFEGSDVYEVRNIAEVISKGMELNLVYKSENTNRNFVLKRASLDYAFTDLDFVEGNYDSKYAGDYLRQKFVISTSIQIYSAINLDYRISYSSRNGTYADYDEINGVRISSDFQPYFLNDLSLYFAKPSYMIYIKVSNLFDIDYNDVGNLIQPGRWVSGGVEFKIEKR